jgi:hypothetical protein
MSSTPSNSTEPCGPAPASGPSRGAVVMVVVTVGLLAVLVWALHPDQPPFTPAPLEPVPTECPKSQREFIPTNYTELPGVLPEDLSPKQKNRALYRLNLEPCTCGCGLSVAACRVSHPRCEISKQLAEKIIAEVRTEGEKRR